MSFDYPLFDMDRVNRKPADNNAKIQFCEDELFKLVVERVLCELGFELSEKQEVRIRNMVGAVVASNNKNIDYIHAQIEHLVENSNVR